MIRVENLHKHFGGFHAVDGASLEIAPGLDHRVDRAQRRGQDDAVQRYRGRAAADLGPGHMGGEDITGLPPHALFHKGLLRTFQIAHEFFSMTVRENLMMVPPRQAGEDLWNRPGSTAALSRGGSRDPPTRRRGAGIS
jgi:branched-chain amino acid transport system ATP-binding protein